MLFDDEDNFVLESFTADHFHMYLVSLKTKTGAIPGIQTFNTVRSALRNMYRVKNLPVPESFKIPNEVFFRGLKRQHAQEKQTGARKMTEGKSSLPFKLYTKIAEYLMKTGNVFSHLYLTLSWNLMCRTDNTQKIMLQHLHWSGDSFQVYFGQMKNDQEGDSLKDARHVYANPLRPCCCPLLSIGMYLLLMPCDSALFPGTSQSSRFSKILSKVILENRDYSLQCGIEDPSDIGTHSIRKGAATYCCSGCTGGPDIGSVSSRCGWKLSGVLDRYIKYEAAGDMFVGRCVSGLPLDSDMFAILPPHFNDSVNNSLLIDTVHELYPVSKRLPNTLSLCTHGLASIIYHAEFLKKDLPSNHILFSSKLFSESRFIDNLKPHIICGTKSIYMTATGIPPHICILRDIKEILQNQMSITEEIVSEIDKLLEEKGVRAGNITPEVLKSMISELMSTFQHSLTTTNTLSSSQSSEEHHWGSLRYPVPDDFALPSCNLFMAWDLWNTGKPADRLPAFKIIQYSDVKDKATRKNLSEWRRVMNLIPILASGVGDNASEEGVVERALRALATKLGVKRARFEQLKVLTVSRMTKKLKLNE